MELEKIFEWVESILQAQYVRSAGMWIDHPQLYGSRVCAIRYAGGVPPSVDDRRIRFQIILLGARDGREYALPILSDANSLIKAAMQGNLPCGAANIRASSEAIGPGYTTENRAWAQVDFEVTI